MKQRILSKCEKNKDYIKRLGIISYNNKTTKGEYIKEIENILKNHNIPSEKILFREDYFLRASINKEIEDRLALALVYDTKNTSYGNWQIANNTMVNINAFLVLNSTENLGIDLFVIPDKHKEDIEVLKHLNKSKYIFMSIFDTENKTSFSPLNIVTLEITLRKKIVNINNTQAISLNINTFITMFNIFITSLAESFDKKVSIKSITDNILYDDDYNIIKTNIGVIISGNDDNLLKFAMSCIRKFIKGYNDLGFVSGDVNFYDKVPIKIKKNLKHQHFFNNNLKEVGFINHFGSKSAYIPFQKAEIKGEFILPCVTIKSIDINEDITYRDEGTLKESVLNDILDISRACVYTVLDIFDKWDK